MTTTETAAVLAESTRRIRIMAQVAVEAIVNHAGDGYDAATIEAVRSEAYAAGVSSFYLDMLPAPELSDACNAFGVGCSGTVVGDTCNTCGAVVR